MKRAMIKNFNTHAHTYFGEFHTVAILFHRENYDTRITDK